jgi:hypothetical protein
MSWKPTGVGDVQGEYIDEYPDQLDKDDSKWWLLGTRESGEAVYIQTERDRIILARQNQNGEIKEIDNRPLSEFNSVWREMNQRPNDEFGWDTWSKYSWAARIADDLISQHARSILSDEQIVAYAFREIVGINREETAGALGKSPNTVDNQLSKARKDIEQAQQFLESMHKNTLYPFDLDLEAN